MATVVTYTKATTEWAMKIRLGYSSGARKKRGFKLSSHVCLSARFCHRRIKEAKHPFDALNP